MAENSGKVVTLGTLGAAVKKIQTDYPTRDEVTKEIENTGGGVVDYATEEEVLALFNDSATEEGGEETT